VFSPDYGELVKKSRRISELQSQREQFMAMLQEVSREVISAEELGLAVTPETIDLAASRLRSQEERLQSERTEIIRSLRATAVAEQPGPSSTVVDELSEEIVGIEKEQERSLTVQRRAEARRAEVENYRTLLGDELSRMERVIEAGSILSDLKVTHCPACDQEIHRSIEDDRECYVCRQSLAAERNGSAERRIQFELDQLRAESDETDELLARLTAEVASLQEERKRLSIEASRVRQALRPIRSAVAAILPPELAITDMNIGRVQERARQLERVRAALSRREDLAQQISRIQAEVAELEAAVSSQTRGIGFEGLADSLADGMNDYLSRLRALKPDSWTQQEISFQLSQRDFRIRVGRSNCKTKLGGTLGLYFQMAYHYALMRLSPASESHYPGLLLVDFPAEMNGVSIGDKENFVLQPFIELLTHQGMDNCQMIAAGSSFANLQGANRIELNTVWK
jgi:hypothetical protein